MGRVLVCCLGMIEYMGVCREGSESREKMVNRSVAFVKDLERDLRGLTL